MKLLKMSSAKSTIYAEIETSTKELQILESIISYTLTNLSDSEISDRFGENFELEQLRENIQKALRKCEKLEPYLAPKSQLKKYVSKFRKWLTENYSEEQIKENLIDDAGYPYWEEIESYFSDILATNQVSMLDKEDKVNLLYLIARNWDIGSMIAWLGQKRPLSWQGKLSDEDFIDLAGTVADINQLEYEDAKCQFISSFKKFEKLTPEIEKILLKTYETGSEYIKRLSLISLAKLGYPDIRNLIILSWETEESEHHKMGCLAAIHEYLEDEDLLKEYIAKASTDNRRYISEYVKKVKSERNL